MRGHQLAAIADGSHLLHRRSVTFEPIRSDVRSSDLFLTKGAARSVDAPTLAIWRRNGNRIMFDPVDEAVADELIGADDTLVAASRSALAAYRERWPHLRIRLVNHHVDPRVIDVMRNARPRSSARAAYFGEVENTVIPASVERDIDVVAVDTSRAEQRWFDRLPPYALHYAVRRPRALDHHKPFLKGFTAAACHANILIQRDQTEATMWLPEDYPFWIEPPVAEESIARALKDAVSAFGSPEWLYGLQVMRELEDASSPRATLNALERLFSE